MSKTSNVNNLLKENCKWTKKPKCLLVYQNMQIKSSQ